MSRPSANVGEDITFKVTTVNGCQALALAQWSFGDGQGASGLQVTHRWTAPQTYQVSVQATFANGRTATASVAVDITPVPVVAKSLTVTVTGNGTVTSLPIGISCPPACTVNFAAGTIVQLSETAATGSQFGGWGGACGGTGTCTVTMDAASTVSARFQRIPIGDFTVALYTSWGCRLRGGANGYFDVNLGFTIGWTGVNGTPMPQNKLRLTTQFGRSRDWGWGVPNGPVLNQGNWIDTFVDQDSRYLNTLLRITVKIDPSDAVPETNEGNNTITVYVDLRGKPVPPPNVNVTVPCWTG